jgi:hypothetical protein
MGVRAITAATFFVLGAAALLLERGLTRILSFALAHNQAALLVAATMLAAALGARLGARRGRARGAAWQAGLGLAGALSLALGLLALARTDLETAELLHSPRIALGLAALLSPFALGWAALGGLVAALLDRAPRRLAPQCAALLLGTAVGAWAASPVLRGPGAPACVALAGALLGLAGAVSARGRAPALAAGAACGALALALGVLRPGLIPDPRPDASVNHLGSTQGALFSRWGEADRVDVFERGPDLRIIYLDGSWSGSLHRFDGDLAAVSGLGADPRGLVYTLAPRPPGRVAVLGADGGRELLQALSHGAREVVAVEEDPLLVALLEDVFADYTGQLARHAGVTLRSEGVLHLAAPRSQAASSAALASALVAPESFQLSAEALAAMLRSLSEHGFLSLHAGELSWEEPLLSLRLLATVREAYRQLGVRTPGPYVAVLTTEGFGQLTTLLLGRSPLEQAQLERLLAAVAELPGAALRYAAGRVFDRGPAIELLLQPDRALDAWLARQPWNLRPISDDAPFPWRWQPLRAPWSEGALGLPGDVHDGRRERLLLWLLGGALALAGWLGVSAAGGGGRGGAVTQLALPLLAAGAACSQAGLLQGLTPAIGDPLRSQGLVLPALLAWAAVGSAVSLRLRARLPGRLAVALLPVLGFGALRLALAPAALPAAAVAPLAVVLPGSFGLAAGALLPATLGAAAGPDGPARAVACLAAAFVAGALLAALVAMLWGFALLLGLGAVLTGAAALLAAPPPLRPA